ncbi:alpha/beta hydrolase [Denitratisoma sp. DHT3]|uniref:alpha/beta hydrolase n=1 Tax=Denitratisoma sp. DHT3 TaxID=1981880 RepID=UPI001647491D|nr:alpha/beta hydrolase [Denitratisoma sp. DHT3]
MPPSGSAGIKAALLSAAFLLLVQGCGGGAALRQAAMNDARSQGFEPQQLRYANFPLLALVRQRAATPKGALSVYIEGDGAPWPSSALPPRDPTPTQATVLTMAQADRAAAVAYLGRPCQYLDASDLARCDPAYWDEARFAPEVIAEYEYALDQLKAGTGAGTLRLTGYSGGGVIAALLAARRPDVEQWTTVGAPLDLAGWTAAQGISPLTRSLDPAQLPPDAGPPPGRHWVGKLDRIVPAAVVRNFTRRHGGTLTVVPDFDHVCCWAEHWPRLLEEQTK